MKLYKKLFTIISLLVFSFILMGCINSSQLDKIKDLLTDELILKDNESIDRVTTNLNLVTSLDEALIEWETSNSNVINLDGEVFRQTEDVTVRLIANITIGDDKDTKAFNLVVLAKEELNGEYTYYLVKTLTDASGNNSYSGDKTIIDEEGNTYTTINTNRVSVNSTAWMPKSTLIFAPRANVAATATINPKISFNQIEFDAGLWNSSASGKNLTVRVEVYIEGNWQSVGNNIYSDIPTGQYKTFTYPFEGNATEFRIVVDGYS